MSSSKSLQSAPQFNGNTPYVAISQTLCGGITSSFLPIQSNWLQQYILIEGGGVEVWEILYYFIYRSQIIIIMIYAQTVYV